MRVIILSMLLLLGCGMSEKKELIAEPSGHQIVAKEVLQVRGYTYVFGSDGDRSLWIATSSVPAEVGEAYYFQNSMEMYAFESKELGRVFDTIYFVDKLSDVSFESSEKEGVTLRNLSEKSTKPVIEKAAISAGSFSGELSVSDIFENKESLEGEAIRISGQVTKFNPAILGKNWIHIQDGTEFNGDFDLTVTANFDVEVGAVIHLEGKLALNKDFGAGYVYKLILEDAVLLERISEPVQGD